MGEFVVRRAVDIVEDRAGETAFGQRPEVMKIVICALRSARQP